MSPEGDPDSLRFSGVRRAAAIVVCGDDSFNTATNVATTRAAMTLARRKDFTAHLLAMYPPFLAVLAVKQAPLGLMVFAFACFANFSAGLTNYGTTPSPMFYAQEYVSMRQWFTAGFVVSLVNLAIWSTVGFAWSKLLGLW